jgi:hypothetical protein
MVGEPALVPALSPAGRVGPLAAPAGRPARIGTRRAADPRSPAGLDSCVRRVEAVMAEIVDDAAAPLGSRNA